MEAAPYMALTISPRNVVFSLFEYNRQKLHICKMLRRCSNEYQIYPELSDSGHLHWHGVFKQTDYRKCHMQVLPSFVKEMGFICVKKVTNLDEWLKYCKKNLSKTEEVIKPSLTEGEIMHVDSSRPLNVRIGNRFLRTYNDPAPLKTLFDYGFIIYKND